MASEYLSTLSGGVCSSFNRRPMYLAAEELWKSLLHLVTYGEWSIDPKTHILSSKGIFSGGKAINVFGLTNKEADGKGEKVYTHLYPLEENLNSLYKSWYSSRNQGRVPEIVDYLETVSGDFYKNPASAYKIKNWKLVK